MGIAGAFFVNHTIKAFTYKNSMQNGRLAIKNRQYHDAQANFNQAVKTRPDSIEANNLLSQTNKFVKAENDFNAYHFKQATATFKEIVSYDKGSAILKERVKSELKEIKPASKNDSRLENIYKKL